MTVSSHDSGLPEFWSERYATGRMPWDLRGVPPTLEAFLREAPSGGRVLIPGCGSGYEVQRFHDAGFAVTAIDFSPAAVARARSLLGPLESSIVEGDFFVYDFGGRRFDLIYDRLFMCSLAPDRWREYVGRMSELLKPDGKLVGIFLYGEEAEPPPFPLTGKVAAEIFQGAFRLSRSEPLPTSLPVLAGKEERWQEWTRA